MIISRGEKLFHIVNVILLALVAVVTLFPILYLVSVSLTPLEAVHKYGFRIIPAEVTLDAYRFILSTPLIPRAFLNSVIITVGGTAINMFLTTLLAYPLSKKYLPGRNVMLLMCIFTMLFTGGLIPTYLLIKNFGWIDKYWAVIMPWAVSTYNLLVMKAFFESLPEELMEAARIDGANEFQGLWQVVLPLSKPVLATIALFYGVGHWNGFFDAMMFITSTDKLPLQVVLRNVLMDALNNSELMAEMNQVLPGEAVKMATVVIAVLPLLLIYPWLQRHFTKGMLLGSIKG